MLSFRRIYLALFRLLVSRARSLDLVVELALFSSVLCGYSQVPVRSAQANRDRPAAARSIKHQTHVTEYVFPKFDLRSQYIHAPSAPAATIQLAALPGALRPEEKRLRSDINATLLAQRRQFSPEQRASWSSSSTGHRKILNARPRVLKEWKRETVLSIARGGAGSRLQGSSWGTRVKERKEKTFPPLLAHNVSPTHTIHHRLREP